ncbi:MAG: orotidine 5'-phosphate decarboxylase [Acidobacteria bacterium 13_1_40CM_2_68_5]|nr:MAG: orotidine 5'-phosphate decarboxylase [Acidobacteria bacterium 13_1_40CM_2_68_5]
MSAMQPSERLIVALDVGSRENALSLVAALRPKVQRFKIGMELFTTCGPPLVREILEKGGQVFLDLKFHDIPNTVARSAVAAARLGVGMFTVHLSGGSMMARRAVDELEAHCQVYRVPRPKVLGVTVLTSLTTDDLEQLGVGRSVEDQVVALAEMGKSAGLDGVVSSPREARLIREACGRDLLIVTPGIRPEGSEQDDQSRTLTPKIALEAGADYLVVGRPIVKADDPLEAAETILLQMDGA